MELVKAVVSKGSVTPQSIAIRAEQKSYTYLQLISSAWKISNLLNNADLKSVDALRGNKNLAGARVGIVAKPCTEFVAGILGTWLCGGVAVPLALSYPEAELLHVMNDLDVSMILSIEDHQELMKTVAAKTAAQSSLIPPVLSISESTEPDQLYNAEKGVHRSFLGTDNYIEIEDEDPALILYTSGTTGKPKGVVHTHRSILAQVQMLANAWEYSPSDQFLHCLPLHHVHGLFNALLAPLYAGSTTRLIQGYEAMDTESQAASASAASQLRLMQWEAITGHLLLERYGMTEFVMAISNPSERSKERRYCWQSLSWCAGTNADIMKVGGYKLSALEIEAVLLEHPAISECCVLGLPDKDYGEALPTRLLLWDSLPRNAMGKVNKKDLKRKIAADGQ